MLIANPIYDVVFKYLLEDNSKNDKHKYAWNTGFFSDYVKKIGCYYNQRACYYQSVRTNMIHL